MKNNRHNESIPADVLKQVLSKIAEVKELLAPYIIALTPSERRDMAKMGSKTIGFVEKSLEFAKHNPGLVPPYLNLDAFSVDLADAKGLWVFGSSIRQLAETSSDTEMAAGNEAYQAALVFYNSVKNAAAQDVPGAKAIYQELKSRFPRVTRKPSKSPSLPDRTEAAR